MRGLALYIVVRWVYTWHHVGAHKWGDVVCMEGIELTCSA